MRLGKLSFGLIFSGVLVFLFLYIPLITLIVYSFNDSMVNTVWGGFSLRWYSKLISDSQMIDAVVNSLIIGVCSSLVSVFFGTLAGVALRRYKVRWLSFLVLTPIAAPELLMGVALLLFYLMTNMTLGLMSVTLAHIAFSLSFVAVTVRSRMEGIDENILNAARDLGANSFNTFIHILLPMLMPGIVAGGLMAFTLSIDDFIITFFTAGPDANTLPLMIYSMIKNGITPEINAVSTLIILATVGLTAVFTRLSNK